VSPVMEQGSTVEELVQLHSVYAVMNIRFMHIHIVGKIFKHIIVLSKAHCRPVAIALVMKAIFAGMLPQAQKEATLDMSGDTLS